MARRRRRATPAEGCLLTLGSSGIRRHRLDCTNVSDGSSAPPPRIAHTVGTAAALPHVGWKAQDGRYNFRVGSYVSGLPQTLAMRTYPFASRARDVYAFGVYTGMSLRRLADKLPAFGQLWAFDSFQGLPAEPAHESHWSPWFRKGGYSAADAYDQHNLGRLIGSVHDLVRRWDTSHRTTWLATRSPPDMCAWYALAQAKYHLRAWLFQSNAHCSTVAPVPLPARALCRHRLRLVHQHLAGTGLAL